MRIEWTRAQLRLARRLAEAGSSAAEIGRALGCSRNTVRRRLRPLIGPRKPGPARFAPDAQEREQVERMAGFGIPHPQIATVLGISKSTLEARFPDELARGATLANVQVVESLFRMAVGRPGRPALPATDTSPALPALEPVPPVPAAAIFWTKARLGWRDRVDVGGVFTHQHEVEHRVDVRAAVEGLSPRGRQALRELLGELGARSSLEAEAVPEDADVVH
jgi:DNA-binding CsgD family transcriptional regulator